MQRQFLDRDGVRLSYLDTGGEGPLLVCLHALWMQAGSFETLANRLFPDWRVVALDQRGHGQTTGATEFALDQFVADAVALIQHLSAGPAVLLGNSLGGTVAVMLAARHPELVGAIVNEEGSVHVEDDLPFIDDWRGNFSDRDAFARAAGPLYWSLAPSVVADANGARLAIDVDDLQATLSGLKQDREADWQAVRCPVLLIGGTDSRVMDQAQLREMAKTNTRAELAMVSGGHVAHEDNLFGFLTVMRPFIDRIRP